MAPESNQGKKQICRAQAALNPLFPRDSLDRHSGFNPGEAASPDRALRDDPKPALHLVEPGGVGGCVVDVEAGPLR